MSHDGFLYRSPDAPPPVMNFSLSWLDAMQFSGLLRCFFEKRTTIHFPPRETYDKFKFKFNAIARGPATMSQILRFYDLTTFDFGS